MAFTILGTIRMERSIGRNNSFKVQHRKPDITERGDDRCIDVRGEMVLSKSLVGAKDQCRDSIASDIIK